MPKFLVTITGSTGRLGFPVVKMLEKRFQLRLLARNATKAKKVYRGKKVIALDLENASVEQIQRAVHGSWAIVHLAGLVNLCASRQQLFLTNFQVTRKLVNACEREKIPFFIHCSTIGVYADSKEKIGENAATRPNTVYGESKLAAENEVTASKLQWVVLRPGIVYGPHFEEGFADVLRQMQKGTAAIIGNGDNCVPLVYEDDVARAFLQCLQLLKRGNKKILRQKFNVVGKAPTQKEAFNSLAKTFGLPAMEKKVPLGFALATASLYSLYCDLVGKRKSFPPEYVQLLARNRLYDVSKAKKLLKFTASTKLENGLGAIKRAWKNLN